MNGTEAPRGYRGTMVAPSTLDDESYLDFVQALRAVAIGPLQRVAEADTRAKVRSQGAPGDPAADRRVVESNPSVGIRNRILRSSQEMLWRRVAKTYDRNRPALKAALDEASAVEQPGLALRPDLRYPAYLAEHHLQRGGYHGDDLAGYVYHYGTKIFWIGHNDRDQAKEALVDAVPRPRDGVVDRLVELGCSVGQSTTAFKRRFPEAEVWGTDIAAPVLRYAHARAARMGVDVHFAQVPAEALDFADASVDLVFASLLFHEFPVQIGQEVVRQVARVLRPGGVFVVSDINPGLLATDPWDEYNRWWDTVHNAEPYEYDFLSSDFTGTLKASFAEVDFEQSGYSGRWVAVR